MASLARVWHMAEFAFVHAPLLLRQTPGATVLGELAQWLLVHGDPAAALDGQLAAAARPDGGPPSQPEPPGPAAAAALSLRVMTRPGLCLTGT